MFGFFKRNRKKHRDAANAEKEQSPVQAPDIEEQAAESLSDESATSASVDTPDPVDTSADSEPTNVEREEAVAIPSAETSTDHAKHDASEAENLAQISRADDILMPVDIATVADESLATADAVREMESCEQAESATEDKAPDDEEPLHTSVQDDATASHAHDVDVAEERATEDAEVSERIVEEEPAAVAPAVNNADALDDAAASQDAVVDTQPAVIETQEKPRREGFFSRIRKGLGKTRSQLTEGLATLFLGRKHIDDDLLEELETQLLMADVGIDATTEIMDRLTERVSRKELADASALYAALQQELRDMLAGVEKPLELLPKGEGPFVILVVGVNGAGKTTTIGKLTRRFQNEGRSVMLAAGDTFRAAAVEQLKVWGDRNNVPVIAQHTGADSASVIYDALSAARARKVDVLIADTAGRLHNKAHLMEELRKVRRVMAKLDENAPHEVLLVLDAGTGQNAIAQARTFSEAAPVTGLVLTKLDGTAKGGVTFALAQQLGIPLRFIGVGESLEDLRPFEAQPFIEALFDRTEDEQSD